MILMDVALLGKIALIASSERSAMLTYGTVSLRCDMTPVE